MIDKTHFQNFRGVHNIIAARARSRGMKRLLALTFFWVIISGFTTPVHGHAMHLYPIDNALGVRAVYDNGQPAAFSEAMVFAPDTETPPFYGDTDANGVFLFYPDRPGQWRVIIDDGMGHKAELVYTIDDDGIVHDIEMQTIRSRAQGVIAGLAILFGVAGGSAWIRSKRISRQP